MKVSINIKNKTTQYILYSKRKDKMSINSIPEEILLTIFKQLPTDTQRGPSSVATVPDVVRSAICREAASLQRYSIRDLHPRMRTNWPPPIRARLWNSLTRTSQQLHIETLKLMALQIGHSLRHISRSHTAGIQEGVRNGDGYSVSETGHYQVDAYGIL